MPCYARRQGDLDVNQGAAGPQPGRAQDHAMLSGRTLSRADLPAIWTIDRSEVIDAIYYLENGTLVLKPEHYDMHEWPPGEPEKTAPMLEDCFDHGGWFYGLFDAGRLVGVAVLESRFIGTHRDQLQLPFLHICSGYRSQGLGRRLFEMAKAEAIRRGAKSIYVSATPSEHTVDFYLRAGCRVALEPDPALLELEPEDIHFECVLTEEGHGNGVGT
jgi:predicted N-acetyltransferase YhbS